mgnify:CR=1 FL=1
MDEQQSFKLDANVPDHVFEALILSSASYYIICIIITPVVYISSG